MPSTLANAPAKPATLTGNYPIENTKCDTSIGSSGFAIACPPTGDPLDPGWSTSSPFLVGEQLTTVQGFLKKMPIDPINNTTYYYGYKPRIDSANSFCNIGTCNQYWIGARLEEPSVSGNTIFRCSDYDNLTPDGPGCKEVGPDNILDTPNGSSPVN